jgi:hypothetical protein
MPFQVARDEAMTLKTRTAWQNAGLLKIMCSMCLSREDLLRIANDGGDSSAIAPEKTNPVRRRCIELCHRPADRSIVIFNIRLTEFL